MYIDLFKLNNLNELNIDEDIIFDSSFYEKTDIKGIKNVHINGTIRINAADELELDALVNGTFILTCAVSLEDVFYDFKTNIEEIIGNFDNFYDKNKNRLDILPFIWENIVSEVPIRVVKEGVKIENTSGDGWELISED